MHYRRRSNADFLGLITTACCLATTGWTGRTFISPQLTTPAACKGRLHLKADDSINLATETLPSIWRDSQEKGPKMPLTPPINTNPFSLQCISALLHVKENTIIYQPSPTILKITNHEYSMAENPSSPMTPLIKTYPLASL